MSRLPSTPLTLNYCTNVDICDVIQRHTCAVFAAQRLINVSSYRPLSAFKPKEVANILKRDAPFAVRIFPVANGALFEQNGKNMKLSLG